MFSTWRSLAHKDYVLLLRDEKKIQLIGVILSHRNLTFAIMLLQKKRNMEKLVRVPCFNNYTRKFTVVVVYLPQINKAWISISIFVCNSVVLCF